MTGKETWIKVSGLSLMVFAGWALLFGLVNSTRVAAQEKVGTVAGSGTLSVPVGFDGPIATINTVPTTIRFPANSGTNSFTLSCMTPQGQVYLKLPLAPGQAQTSFSCNASSNELTETINETCTGTSGVCKLTFLP
jgi:hypothetical protein